MTATLHNLTPKTRPCPASDIKVGDVVVETWEHPVVITRVARKNREVYLYCRYVWQAPRDPEWKLGTFRPTQRLPKAVQK